MLYLKNKQEQTGRRSEVIDKKGNRQTDKNTMRETKKYIGNQGNKMYR